MSEPIKGELVFRLKNGREVVIGIGETTDSGLCLTISMPHSDVIRAAAKEESPVAPDVTVVGTSETLTPRMCHSEETMNDQIQSQPWSPGELNWGEQPIAPREPAQIFMEWIPPNSFRELDVKPGDVLTFTLPENWHGDMGEIARINTSLEDLLSEMVGGKVNVLVLATGCDLNLATEPAAAMRWIDDPMDVFATNEIANDPCPQEHHLKDGPCMSDYCRCPCPRCRKQCKEKR